MEDTDDFHSLKRKDLQALCKKHLIPANLTNLEMANRLTELLKVKEKPVVEKLDVVSEIESYQVRKVRFSPDNEVFEFTSSRERKRSRMRSKRMSGVEVIKSADLDSEIGMGEEMLTEKDLCGMKRKELQGLCKKHKVPANLKNEELVNRLVEVFNEKEKAGYEEVMIEKGENVSEYEETEDLVVSKKAKKVRFSPEHEVIEFTRLRATCRGRKSSVLSRNSTLSAVNVNGSELGGEKVGRFGRKGKGGAVKETAEEKVVGEPQVLSRRSSRRGNAVESSELEAGCSQVDAEGLGAKIESGEKLETVPENQDTVKVESRRSRRKSVFPSQEQKEITEECGDRVDFRAKVETVTENLETMKVEPRRSRRMSLLPSQEQMSNYEIESKKQKNEKVSKSKVSVMGDDNAGDDSHIDQEDLRMLSNKGGMELTSAIKSGKQFQDTVVDILELPVACLPVDVEDGVGEVESGGKLETVPQNQETVKEVPRRNEGKVVLPSHGESRNNEVKSKKQPKELAGKRKLRVSKEDTAVDVSSLNTLANNTRSTRKGSRNVKIAPAAVNGSDERKLSSILVESKFSEASQVVLECIASVSEVAESINLVDSSRNIIIERSKIETMPPSVMNSNLEIHEEKSYILQKSHTYCGKENYDMIAEKANLSLEADVHDLVEESTRIAHNGNIAAQVVSLTESSSFRDTADCDEVMETSNDFASAAFAKTSLSTDGTSTSADQAYFKSYLEVTEGELEKCIGLSFDLVDAIDETKCVPIHENHAAVEPVCMDDNIPALEFVVIDPVKVSDIRPEEKNGDIAQRTIHKSTDQTIVDDGYKAFNQSDDISDVNTHVSEGEIDSTVLKTDLGLAQPSAAKLMREKRDKHRAEEEIPDKVVNSDLAEAIEGCCLFDSNGSAGVKEVCAEYASARDSNGEGAVHEISNVVDVILKDHIESGLEDLVGGQSATRVLLLSEAIACDHYCSKDADISTGRTKSEAENDLQGASDTLYGLCEDAEEGRFVDIGRYSMSGGNMSLDETVRCDELGFSNIDGTQKPEEQKGTSTDDVYVTESCEGMLVDTVYSDISCKKMSVEEITRDDGYETLMEVDEIFNIDSTQNPDSENRFQATMATLLNNGKCVIEEEDSIDAPTVNVETCKNSTINNVQGSDQQFQSINVSEVQIQEIVTCSTVANVVLEPFDKEPCQSGQDNDSELKNHLNALTDGDATSSSPNASADGTKLLKLSISAGTSSIITRCRLVSEKVLYMDGERETELEKSIPGSLVLGTTEQDLSPIDCIDGQEENDLQVLFATPNKFEASLKVGEAIALENLEQSSCMGTICSSVPQQELYEKVRNAGSIEHLDDLSHGRSAHPNKVVVYEDYMAKALDVANLSTCKVSSMAKSGAHEPCEEKYPIINMDEADAHEPYEKWTTSELQNVTNSVTQRFDVEASSSTGQTCNEHAVATSSKDNGSGPCVYVCNESVQHSEVAVGPSDADVRRHNGTENKCDFAALSKEKSVMKERFINAVVESSEMEVAMDYARGEPDDEIGKENVLELLFATPVKSKDSYIHDETSTGSDRTLNGVSCEEAVCPVRDDTVIESKWDDIDRVLGSDNEKIMDDEMDLASINQESSTASVAGKKENELQLLFATPVKGKAPCELDDMPADSERILEHRSCKEYFCSMEDNVVVDSRSVDIDVGTLADNEVVDASSVLASTNQSSYHPSSVAGKRDNELHLMSATPFKIDDSCMLNDTSGGPGSILEDASHKESFCKMEGNIVIQESKDIDVVTGPDHQKTVDGSSILATTNQGSDAASVEGREENELRLLLLTPIKFEATCVIDETSAGSECTLKDVSSIDGFCSMDESTVTQNKSEKIDGGSRADFVKMVHGSSSSTFSDQNISSSASVEGAEESGLRLLFETPIKMESSCRVDEASGSERIPEDTSCMENDVSMEQGMSCEKIGKKITTSGGKQVTSQVEGDNYGCGVALVEPRPETRQVAQVTTRDHQDNNTMTESSIDAPQIVFTNMEGAKDGSACGAIDDVTTEGDGSTNLAAHSNLFSNSHGDEHGNSDGNQSPSNLEKSCQENYEESLTCKIAIQQNLIVPQLDFTTLHSENSMLKVSDVMDTIQEYIDSEPSEFDTLKASQLMSESLMLTEDRNNNDTAAIYSESEMKIADTDQEDIVASAEPENEGCAEEVTVVLQEHHESENRLNMSALKQFPTAKKKARAIPIDGTPRKPLVKSGDMKENAPMAKYPPAGNITTMRPAKRRALQDI